MMLKVDLKFIIQLCRGEQMPEYSAPESFNVMIKELQGLCIDVELD